MNEYINYRMLKQSKKIRLNPHFHKFFTSQILTNLKTFKNIEPIVSTDTILSGCDRILNYSDYHEGADIL